MFKIYLYLLYEYKISSNSYHYLELYIYFFHGFHTIKVMFYRMIFSSKGYSLKAWVGRCHTQASQVQGLYYILDNAFMEIYFHKTIIKFSLLLQYSLKQVSIQDMKGVTLCIQLSTRECEFLKWLSIWRNSYIVMFSLFP